MPYNRNHYDVDDSGYRNAEEANRAADNGHLDRLSNGNFYDRETGEEYWSDGEKKN